MKVVHVMGSYLDILAMPFVYLCHIHDSTMLQQFHKTLLNLVNTDVVHSSAIQLGSTEKSFIVRNRWGNFEPMAVRCARNYYQHVCRGWNSSVCHHSHIDQYSLDVGECVMALCEDNKLDLNLRLLECQVPDLAIEFILKKCILIVR